MMMKNTAKICILGLLIGIGGCRKHTGSRNFSFSFNSEKEEALTTVVKMYDSLCRELESRGFRILKTTESLEMRSTHCEGEYDSFPLTIEIHYLLSVSEEEPEFHYRVSFEETTAVNELDKAAKDFRVLMEQWCNHKNYRAKRD